MFGHSHGDWASPYEFDDDVGVQHTTFYRESAPATVYRGQKAIRGGKGIGGKAIKGAAPYAGGHPAAYALHAERLRRASQTQGFRYHSGLTGALAHARRVSYHRGLYGLGDVDIPYATSKGAQGTAHMTSGSNCGDLFGLQQALNDLGYPCAVDGIFGPETSGAMSSFAQEHGVIYQKGTLPEPSFCQALEDAWVQTHGASPPPTPGPEPAPAPVPGTSTAAPPSGALDRLKAWWDGSTSTTKAAVVGGGVLAGVLVVMAVRAHSHHGAHAHG